MCWLVRVKILLFKVSFVRSNRIFDRWGYSCESYWWSCFFRLGRLPCCRSSLFWCCGLLWSARADDNACHRLGDLGTGCWKEYFNIRGMKWKEAGEISIMWSSHYLYSSPDIIRIMKAKRIGWAGYVARIGKTSSAYKYLVRKQHFDQYTGYPDWFFVLWFLLVSKKYSYARIVSQCGPRPLPSKSSWLIHHPTSWHYIEQCGPTHGPRGRMRPSYSFCWHLPFLLDKKY
jgi:hypothetical protein